jgi:hypothetical protein
VASRSPGRHRSCGYSARSILTFTGKANDTTLRLRAKGHPVIIPSTRDDSGPITEGTPYATGILTPPRQVGLGCGGRATVVTEVMSPSWPSPATGGPFSVQVATTGASPRVHSALSGLYKSAEVTYNLPNSGNFTSKQGLKNCVVNLKAPIPSRRIRQRLSHYTFARCSRSLSAPGRRRPGSESR